MATNTDRRFGVDSSAAIKTPVKVATTANITLSALQTIDDIAVAAGDRVLVKNQTSGVNNGIYSADTGSWTRTADFDGTYDALNGTLVFVNQGTTNVGWWYITTADPITIGTSSVNFGMASTALAVVTPFAQTLLAQTTSNAALTILTALRAETGAVAVSVLNKLREQISALDFGATGNGVTDDTAAIQNAINAAASSGKTLWFPPGTYKVTSPLAVTTAGMVWIGSGYLSTQFVASGNFLAVIAVSGVSTFNVKISRIGIQVNYTTTQCINIAESTNTSPGTNPITFDSVRVEGGAVGPLVYCAGNVVEFFDCSFLPQSSGTKGLQYDKGSGNSTVTKCRFIGGGVGLEIVNTGAGASGGIRIVNNLFANIGAAYNIRIGTAAEVTIIKDNVLDQALTSSIDIGSGAFQTIIEGNWIGLQGGSAGVCLIMHETTGKGTLVQGNVFGPCNYGIQMIATAINRIVDVVVQGNIFAGNALSALIMDSVLGCSVYNNVDEGATANGSWTTTATYGAGSYLFGGNSWKSTAPAAFDTGSSYRFDYDYGLAGHNRGSNSTAGAATTLVINHGCFQIPNKIVFSLEAVASPGGFWITNVTSTQFTANWTTNQQTKVHWDAEV